MGSSPRMRGALERRVLGVAVDGIIPAYARSTSVRPSTPRGAGDHPRVCGEHSSSRALPEASGGSSPRMRGALALHLADREALGIIPAYAGGTSRPRPSTATTRDHPRVCGEHAVEQSFSSVLPGSSPRMRGAPFFESRPDRRAGIIPAYAGSTATGPRRGSPVGDHPRVCGEHFSSAQESSPFCAGSSPRMRGARLGTLSHVPPYGTIPAYAGSTCPRGPGRPCRWDHPRVCGEHTGLPSRR